MLSQKQLEDIEHDLSSEIVLINDLEDLDYKLYEKNFISSPNIPLRKFIVLSCAGKKYGQFNTVEEVFENFVDATIVSAKKYFKEV